MTPEEKQKIKEEIVAFYGEVFPGYPENPAVKQDPRMMLDQLPRIYDRLVEKNLITKEKIPYKYFEAIAVDKFQEAAVLNAINSFF